ncbi:MAG: Glycyl-glycine endopeptidase LytM [Syntrophomonadaceae bacterium]|nr:Glycyl-glycine endopeptidase LytM [Bacillota bacterium]
MDRGEWCLPVVGCFRITQRPGEQLTGYNVTPHAGVDLAMPEGTPVPSLRAGRVRDVFTDRWGGLQVRVEYADRGEGWFAHLSRAKVQPGDVVQRGTIIGRSGSTGNVTGPHLHYEERDAGGALVDPTDPRRTGLIGQPPPAAASCPAISCAEILAIGRLRDQGVSTAEIARRYKTTPECLRAAAYQCANDPLGAGARGIAEDAGTRMRDTAGQVVIGAAVIVAVLVLAYMGARSLAPQ